MLRTVFVLVVFFIHYSVFAQSFPYNGQIINEGGIPVRGAKVIACNALLYTTTDSLGVFGNYGVPISYPYNVTNNIRPYVINNSIYYHSYKSLEDVKITIFDLRGREIFKRETNSKKSGLNIIKINPNDILGSGIYLLNFKNDNKNFQIKILKTENSIKSISETNYETFKKKNVHRNRDVLDTLIINVKGYRDTTIIINSINVGVITLTSNGDIIDIKPPTIILNVDNPDYVLVNSISSYVILAEVYDTVNDSVVVDYTSKLIFENSVDPTVSDTYNIFLSVSDNAGNAAHDTLMVIVFDSIISPKDTIPPIVTLLGDSKILHQVNTPYIDPGAMAIDDVDEVVPVIAEGLSSINVTALGYIYIIIYYAVDKAGNKSKEIKRIVEIVDSIESVPNMTIESKITQN